MGGYLAREWRGERKEEGWKGEREGRVEGWVRW